MAANENPNLNLGFKLKTAREAQDLSLDEIAAELRIGVDLLNALEECRFDELGAQVFGKGYLKQYAGRLGLDVAEVVADYEQSVGEQPVEISPSQTIKLRDEQQITIWIIAGIVLLVIGALLWAWWWLGSSSGLDPVPEAALAESILSPDLPPVEAQAATPAEPPTQPQFEPLVEFPEIDDTVVTVTDVSEAVPTDGPQLEVIFVGESWAEITTNTGERLYYDLGLAGSRALVPAEPGMNLFFGNVAGVELAIEGQAVPIPAALWRGNLAQFNLDALVDIADFTTPDSPVR